MQIVNISAFKFEYATSYIFNIEKNCFSSDFITLEDIIENYSKTYFLLDIDQNVLGYYMWYTIKNSNYLFSLAIDKYYQGNGFAKILLEHFLKQLAKSHCLHLNKNNNKAFQLYIKYGFKIINLEENFYKDGSSAYLMQRENENSI